MKKILMFVLIVCLLNISFSSIKDEVNKQFEIMEEVSREMTDAVFTGSCGVGTTSAVLKDYLINSFLAIFISLLISVLSYYAVKVVGQTNINPSSILAMKVQDTIVTVLIVIIFGGMFMAVGGTNYGFLRNSMEFTRELVFEASTYIMFLSFLNTGIVLLSQLAVPLPFNADYVFSVTINFQQAVKPLIDASFTIANFYSLLLSEWVGKFFVLCFMRFYAYPVLIPLGVLLRSFNFTKGAGNALIAITLSFFFVYPVMLSFNYALYKSTIGKLSLRKLSPVKIAIDYVGPIIIYVTSVNIATKVFSKLFGPKTAPNWIKKFLYTSSGALKGFGLFAGLAARSFQLVVLIGGLMMITVFVTKILIQSVNLIVVYSFLLTALNVYVTLVLAQEISRHLGTELELSAFTRVL